jgi:hypothetical protein
MLQPVEIEQISALLIAYQRPENVREILTRVVSAGIRDIYISLDFPREVNAQSLKRRDQIFDAIADYAANPELRIRVSTFSKNVGCGVAVTSACDWFFNCVEIGVVIEDDCIPSPGFFRYMQYALGEILTVENLYTASGSRLHPNNSETNDWEINKFPVFWGWGSTSQKWKRLSSNMRRPLPSFRSYPSKFTINSFYWRAGSRRVREGFVDTWDTLISELFHRLNYWNLSPATSYVTNVGNDEFATHDMSYVSNLPRSIDEFTLPTEPPIFSSARNKECGSYLYRYGLRHPATTLISKILDRTIRARQAQIPFVERLEDGISIYSEIEIGIK